MSIAQVAGAITPQIVLAVVVSVAMIWVFWIGARSSSKNPPIDRTPPGGNATDG
jgi:hypothetical protein